MSKREGDYESKRLARWRQAEIKGSGKETKRSE